MASKTATASPLWARVVAILLFLLAAGVASLATVLGTRFGLRSLPPEDQWIINLFAGCFAAAALACTIAGLFFLFIFQRPLPADR